MKNMLAGAVFGVAALGANSQTQTQSANTQADVKGRALSSFIVPFTPGIPGITAGVRHDSVYGDGGSITFSGGDDKQAIGVTATVLSDSKSVKVAGAKEITDGVMLTGHIGKRQDSAAASFGNPGYTGNISAVEYGAGLQAKVNEYMMLGSSVTRGNTTGGLLRSDTNQTTANRVVETDKSIQYWKDTFQSRTDTIAKGGQYTEAKVNVSYQPTLSDLISADLGARQSSITGRSVVGGAAYTHTFDSGDSATIAGAHVAPRVNTVDIGFTKVLTQNSSATIGVGHRTGANKSTGVFATYNTPFNFGSNLPDAPSSKSSKTTSSTKTPNFSALGSVNTELGKEIEPVVGNVILASHTSASVLVSRTMTREDIKPEPVVVTPIVPVVPPVVPPVKPPETPNTAPSAVSFAPGAVMIAEKLAIGQAVGQLSCLDFAPTGAQNSCTYSGSNANFAVSMSGAITLSNTSLSEGVYTFTVTATDAGGLPKIVSVSVQVQEPCFGLTGEILQSCILSH